MDTRAQREREIFDACLDLPLDERPEYVRARCAGDSELEDRIHRLLAAHDRAQAHTGHLPVALPAQLEDPERIGPFRILERLGEGGMGVVYVAEQTEPVRRRVALKLIKLGMDTREVIARFESERQALAMMSHQNIARMLDAGATDQGRPYFVMEYVPGVPITDYCDRKRLGVRERLELLLDVCGAVQHAHQKGVIHRDLKPSNILVTEEDGEPVCKIIDFGVAKATNQKLTELTVYTELGRVIGTPEYMSPEQVDASALDVDTRSDIYSLGVLLYELLTGSRPFEFQGTDKDFSEVQRLIREVEAEPPSDRMARLAELVPAVALKRGSTPASLVRGLRGELDWIAATALAKEPRRRYQTARELADDLHRYLDDRPLQASSRRTAYRARKFLRRHRAGMAAAGALLAAIVLGVGLLSGEVVERLARALLGGEPVVRAMIAVGPDEGLWLGSTRSIAIAPDGRSIAYIGRVSGDTYLYIRDVGSWNPRQVRDSRGARTPFFSPDGAWIGFFAQGQLRRARVDGMSVPETITEVGLLPRGVSWGPDDRIAFSVGPRGILVVPATGGEARPITEPDAAAGELEHQWPRWLPAGDALLYTVTRSGESGIGEAIAVVSLREGDRRVLHPHGAQPVYVASGHLVYAHAGALEAVPFDPDRLEVTGPSVTVLDEVRAYPAASAEGATYFDVAWSDALLYVPPPVDRPIRLDWVDREGRITSTVELPGVPGWPRISPDGRRAAIHVGATDSREVWILDLERPGSIRQLTSRGGGFPTWSPDGTRIAFTSRREGSSDIYIMPADGSEEPVSLLRGERTQIPTSWSRQGVIAYYEVAGTTQRDVMTVELPGGPPRPFVRTPANELGPVFSPDGAAIAYVSNESGRNEVYVRAYPPPGPVTVVSIDGGSEPVWAAGGDELYYRHEHTIMIVPVRTQPTLSAGQPRPLFSTDMVDDSAGNASYDVAPDGRRFLMLRSGGGAPGDRLHLVVNWTRELGELAAGGSTR